MALFIYMKRVQRLLHDQAQMQMNPNDIIDVVNLARSQLAGESGCIRNFASLTLSANTKVYAFSSVVLGSPSAGIAGILRIEQALVQVGSGLSWLHPRSIPRFTLYALNRVVPLTGRPVRWMQYGQGITGSMYVDPIPDQTYTLSLDTICYPNALALDSDAEAIPYPWTDCVSFFAAYYALMEMQRKDEADAMYARYEQYAQRARTMSNAEVLPHVYAQSPDLTLPNKLGMKQPKQTQTVLP